MLFVEGQLANDFLLSKEAQELRTVLKFQMGNEAAHNLRFVAVQLNLW